MLRAATVALPFVAIYLSPLPAWLSRMMVAAILMAVLTVGAFWLCLDPRAPVIGQGAKLRRPEYRRSRRVVERLMRILAGCFGVAFLWVVDLPFLADAVEISAAGARSIPALVTAASGSLLGVKQSAYLRLSEGRAAEPFTLLFSLKRLHAGERGSFVVARRARLILDFQLSD